MRQHPRLAYEALVAQGAFPPEMLMWCCHHHEFLDGIVDLPRACAANQISDIVRPDHHRGYLHALVEKRARSAAVHPHAEAVATMEKMGVKL